MSRQWSADGGVIERESQGRLALFDEVDRANRPNPEASRMVRSRPQPTRGFGGFAWSQIAGFAVLFGLLAWCAWLTRETMTLRDRRIVAVNLSSLVNDFIVAEARSGNSPDLVERETRQFMVLLDSALAERAGRGETIVVAEAVVAGSVPNITADIRQRLGKAMTINGSPGSRPRSTHAPWGRAEPAAPEATGRD